ncbi:MAG: threonine/serine dehydratase [Planctomycetota bacterium]
MKPTPTTPVDPPRIDAVRAARARLRTWVRETPMWEWCGGAVERRLPAGTSVFMKLELFQHTGSFKPRGALCQMLDLGAEQLARGVTAVSAGNHAMAVAYAARALGTTAKVVMPQNANPWRVAESRAYGAEVVLVENVHRAFEETKRIESEEGRAFVHPFEGPGAALGTATLGLELLEQRSDLEAVIVPIGGGGLCAGVACAVKSLRPECRVYGVEPEGADTMHRSFAAGESRGIDAVRTIADSLGAPHAAPYSFELCRRFVDELVRVDDNALRGAMATLFTGAKLAVEPAGAAATAALFGPLADRVAGQRVAVIVCGSNIDLQTYGRLTGCAP